MILKQNKIINKIKKVINLCQKKNPTEIEKRDADAVQHEWHVHATHKKSELSKLQNNKNTHKITKHTCYWC